MKKIIILLLVFCLVCSPIFNVKVFADQKNVKILCEGINIVDSLPIYIGQKVNIKFTLRNIGREPVNIDTLTVGIKDEAGNLKNSDWKKYVVIEPETCYEYQGSYVFDKKGKYNLTVKLRLDDKLWYEALSSDGKISTVELFVEDIPEYINFKELELPKAFCGKEYGPISLKETGFILDKYKLSSGTIPKGLELKDEGIISGSPKVSGEFQFKINGVNEEGKAVERKFILNVDKNMSILAGVLKEIFIGEEFDINSLILRCETYDGKKIDLLNNEIKLKTSDENVIKVENQKLLGKNAGTAVIFAESPKYGIQSNPVEVRIIPAAPMSNNDKKPFLDISDHWAKTYIIDMYLKSIINGYPDGKFYPEKNITRAEFATMIYKAIQSMGYLSSEKFTDIKNHWAYNYILKTLSLFSHIDADKYNPDEYLTREEVIAVVMNFVGSENSVLDKSLIKVFFKDGNKISKSFISNVAEAVYMGIVKGYEDGTIRPNDKITRGEVCKILYNALRLGGKSIIDFNAKEELPNSAVVIDINNNSGNKTTEKTGQNNTSNTSKQNNTNEISQKPSTNNSNVNQDTQKELNKPTAQNNNTNSTNNNSLQTTNEPVYKKGTNPYDMRPKRLEYIFGKKSDGTINFYTTKEDAEKNMSTFEVRVWDINSKTNQKYTKKITITVNKKIENQVKAIFESIYNSEEKFPICCVASYAWRQPFSNGKLSEHNYGTCIDINPNANPYIVNGQNLSGEKWEPGVNPYSITTEGSVLKAFREYGWIWGGTDWGKNCIDYMHFSYLGH